MKLLFLLILFPLTLCSQQLKEEFTSVKIGDTYELIIRKPKNFDSTKTRGKHKELYSHWRSS